MQVEAVPEFWEAFDEAYEALAAAVLKGQRTVGTAADFHNQIANALLGLEQDPKRHPTVSAAEDPAGRGFRAVRVGQWRILFRLPLPDLVRVVALRHAWERPREVIDRG